MKKKQVTEKLILSCFVAGLIHSDFVVGVSALKVGQKLRLIKEPSNAFDSRAIAVYAGETRVGYIPRDQTRLVHDCNQPLRCVVKQFAPTNPTQRMVYLDITTRTVGNPVAQHEFASY